MFDVTDKRAVDRLAAVVVMLEQREATARQAYDLAGKQLRGRGSMDRVRSMSAEQLATEQDARRCAGIRWTEAHAALAAARELATNR